ncbi:hypothetical protein AYO45_01290 [Gammaproteobacteria bacterium SCGC AG-212-F23]|nr:hypothetical protein AYO45_01290 [Gammaproteobacteria bacterium SCGC AG-212-F23]
MNLRHWLLFFFALLSASLCYAADSTTITFPLPTNIPPPGVPATLVTVVVKHIAQNVSPQNAVSCPKAPAKDITNGTWTGKSPVKDGTLASREVFYPYDSNYVAGYLVFDCSETYWSTDPYYLQLASTTTVPCQNDIYTPSVCTIFGKSNNVMSGVLPIHFTIDVPKQAQMAAFNAPTGVFMETASFYAPTLTFGFPTDINGRTFSWGTDFSGIYNIGAAMTLGLTWNSPYAATQSTLWMKSTNQAITSSAPRNYVCPGPLGHGMHLNITNDMLGKTCHIKCIDSQWSTATVLTNYTYTAPLMYYCEDGIMFTSPPL